MALWPSRFRCVCQPITMQQEMTDSDGEGRMLFRRDIVQGIAELHPSAYAGGGTLRALE